MIHRLRHLSMHHRKEISAFNQSSANSNCHDSIPKEVDKVGHGMVPNLIIYQCHLGRLLSFRRNGLPL